MNPVPKPTKQKKESKLQEWNRIRKILVKEFEEMGVTRCEIHLPDCTPSRFLGFAHTAKRRDVTDLKVVILACSNCHQKIEYACRRWTGKTMKEFVEWVIAHRVKNYNENN